MLLLLGMEMGECRMEEPPKYQQGKWMQWTCMQAHLYWPKQVCNRVVFSTTIQTRSKRVYPWADLTWSGKTRGKAGMVRGFWAEFKLSDRVEQLQCPL